jgi:hypothetical protein
MQLGHHLGGHVFVQRFTMPAFLVLDAVQTFAFQSARQHDGGPVGSPARGVVGREQLGDAVTINDQRLPAESLPAGLVNFQVVLQHRGLALAEPIDVDSGAQVAYCAAMPIAPLPIRILRPVRHRPSKRKRADRSGQAVWHSEPSPQLPTGPVPAWFEYCSESYKFRVKPSPLLGLQRTDAISPELAQFPGLSESRLSDRPFAPLGNGTNGVNLRSVRGRR